MDNTFNASSPASRTAFHYGLLPSDQIRLLQVSREPNPMDGEPRLHCKMESRLLGKIESCKFTAISYTWGSPRATSRSRILVNGQLLEIRPNCEHALSQACDYDSQAWYWIDSVCINQDDSTEKMQQVAHMGQIYKYAQLVLACVGEHAESSEELLTCFNKEEDFAVDGAISRRCRCMRDILSCCREAFPPLDTLEKMLSARHSGLPNQNDHTDFVEDVDKRSAQEMARLWEHARPDTKMPNLWSQINAFLCRPYFQRLWVFQELFLGTQVIFCCGDHFVPARRLNELFEELSVYYGLYSVSPFGSLSRPPESSKEYWKISDELEEGWTDPNRKPALLLRAGASPEQPTKRLHELLKLVLEAELQCENVRDRCFGILGLVDWKGYDPIEPNYDKNILEVAMEVLAVLLGDDGPEEYCQSSKLMSHARTVADVFRLDSQQSSGLWWTPILASAIDRRTSSALNSLAQPTVNETRRLRVFGEAFRLRENYGEWLLEGYRHPVTIVPFQEFSLDALKMSIVEVTDGVFLPKQAEDGDWCFFFQDYLTFYRVILLFRKSRTPSTNMFEIVGQGITVPGHEYGWGNWKVGTAFDAFLALEDFLFSVKFSKLINEVEKSRAPDSLSPQPSTFLQISFCGHSGSSYIQEKKVARSED